MSLIPKSILFISLIQPTPLLPNPLITQPSSPSCVYATLLATLSAGLSVGRFVGLSVGRSQFSFYTFLSFLDKFKCKYLMNKKQQFLSFFLICCSVFPLAGSCVHQFRIQSFSRETILIAKISSFFPVS